MKNKICGEMKVLTTWELFRFCEAETETNINYGTYKQ